MIYNYKTDELVIVGEKPKFEVYKTKYNPEDGSFLVDLEDLVFKGTLKNCQAFIEGYVLCLSECDIDEN